VAAARDTPLHKAAQLGKFDLVQLLAAHGADVAAANNAGCSAYPSEEYREYPFSMRAMGSPPALL
jgi:hypothetical protein